MFHSLGDEPEFVKLDVGNERVAVKLLQDPRYEQAPACRAPHRLLPETRHFRSMRDSTSVRKFLPPPYTLSEYNARQVHGIVTAANGYRSAYHNPRSLEMFITERRTQMSLSSSGEYRQLKNIPREAPRR